MFSSRGRLDPSYITDENPSARLWRTDVQVFPVIEMDHDGDRRMLRLQEAQGRQCLQAGVGDGARGDRQDHRGSQLFCGLHDALDEFEIVDVECGDAILCAHALPRTSVSVTNATGVLLRKMLGALRVYP